jgi:hypothetical protein
MIVTRYNYNTELHFLLLGPYRLTPGRHDGGALALYTFIV